MRLAGGLALALLAACATDARAEDYQVAQDAQLDVNPWNASGAPPCSVSTLQGALRLDADSSAASLQLTMLSAEPEDDLRTRIRCLGPTRRDDIAESTPAWFSLDADSLRLTVTQAGGVPARSWWRIRPITWSHALLEGPATLALGSDAYPGDVRIELSLVGGDVETPTVIGRGMLFERGSPEDAALSLASFRFEGDLVTSAEPGPREVARAQRP